MARRRYRTTSNDRFVPRQMPWARLRRDRSLRRMLPTLNKFIRTGAVAALATMALAGTAQAAQKVTPDVTGVQRVLVVGCRFHDTTSPDILDYANPGIRQILSRTHDYFDVQSNHRVDFEGEFTGWNTLPKSVNDYGADGNGATKDCQDI